MNHNFLYLPAWTQTPDANDNTTWNVNCFPVGDSATKVLQNSSLATTRITVDGLQPGVEYECQVTTVFAGLNSDMASILQLTAPGVV